MLNKREFIQEISEFSWGFLTPLKNGWRGDNFSDFEIFFSISYFYMTSGIKKHNKNKITQSHLKKPKIAGCGPLKQAFDQLYYKMVTKININYIKITNKILKSLLRPIALIMLKFTVYYRLYIRDGVWPVSYTWWANPILCTQQLNIWL